MQLFRNAVLSVPTSFFDLTSLRQAVRLACFLAAASLAAIVAGVIAAGVAAELTADKRQRHRAVAAVEKIRILLPWKTLSRGLEPMDVRITSPDNRTDEARMKLA